MTLHLVGGFLGSGKTTAIRSACALLRRRGQAASVITNDQGTLLVDTAYLRGPQPTYEVTGGCFCCRYDRLVDLLAAARRGGAQHVFAEAVGSCADLAATVVRPLLGSTAGPVERVSFTVMVDARLLSRLQAGGPLPWSDNVAYLFCEQLREAPLLVASKWDLVTDPRAVSVRAHGSGVPAAGQTVLRQDGRTPAGVARWVGALADAGHPATAAAGACDLGIDYGRYGAGEEALAWLDAEVRIDAGGATDGGGARAAAARLVRAVIAGVSRQADAIGHLKFLIRDHLHDVKVSHTAADDPPDAGAARTAAAGLRELDRLSDRQLYVVVNARAEIGAERLQRLLDRAAAASGGGAAAVTVIRSAAFHPAAPQPAALRARAAGPRTPASGAPAPR